MKKLSFAALLALSATAQAASFSADVTFMGASMPQAYIKVVSVSGGDSGWSCNLSTYASSQIYTPATTTTLASSLASTKDFTITAPYGTDADAPINLCLVAAKAMPIFTSIK